MSYDSVSKHNSNCEKQVIHLMIPTQEKWHYLAVKKKKKKSALLRGIKLKNSRNFYFLNCLHSFTKKQT